MTLIERTTKSANSLANQTVSTVAEIGSAVAEGVISTTKDIQDGIQTGRIRPITMVAAAALGLITVVEWPVVLAAAGAAVIISKLKNQNISSPQQQVPDLQNASVGTD